MNCSIEGCDNPVMYKTRQICQMHYFRYMRNGTYEKVQKRRTTVLYTPNGYKRVFMPNHDLSTRDGFVFEHRALFYNLTKGLVLSCDFCGADWSFRSYRDHVDHIDNDKLNNSIYNLRPLCNACNTGRGKGAPCDRDGTLAITYLNKTMTPEEWSREEISSVCGHTISRRFKSGWSAVDAITKPSRTYKGKRRSP